MVTYEQSETTKKNCSLGMRALPSFFFGPVDIIALCVQKSTPVATLTKPKIIGCVSSDSGSLSIIDPTHLEVSEAGAIRFPRWNLFTAFDTELGDGEFCVYAQRDNRGKLKRVIIEID